MYLIVWFIVILTLLLMPSVFLMLLAKGLQVLNKTSPGRMFFQFRACLQHGTTVRYVSTAEQVWVHAHVCAGMYLQVCVCVCVCGHVCVRACMCVPL